MFILPGSKATKRDKRDNKKTSEPFFQYLFQWLEETFYQTYIISYNFGQQNPGRVARTIRLALKTALGCGILFFTATLVFNHEIVGLFIDKSYKAYDIAVDGIPYFAVGYLFFALNIVGIGYYQSIERARRATVITLFRGTLFMLTGFLLLPPILGIKGIWLAVPLAELLTLLLIIGIYLKDSFAIRR